MFTFLRVPWAKTITDVINIAKERITSLKHELKVDIQVETVYQALIEGFQKAFAIKLPQAEKITNYEQKLAKNLKKQKYNTRNWLFTRLEERKHYNNEK
jgi:lipoate-protein ligase A